MATKEQTAQAQCKEAVTDVAFRAICQRIGSYDWAVGSVSQDEGVAVYEGELSQTWDSLSVGGGRYEWELRLSSRGSLEAIELYFVSADDEWSCRLTPEQTVRLERVIDSLVHWGIEDAEGSAREALYWQ